ncbi:MAG: FtsW/RodA/SpoVE family cell cycle protein, partial [Eggerthellaceae bacterium]|nr:FtsW/RodA/SpoVE family cell cycle protein [Eggerthellaceae bacterium]
MARSAQQSKKRMMDGADIVGPRLILVLVVVALILLGFVMIYSASSIKAIAAEDNAMSYMFNQIKFAVIGTVAAVVLWKAIPYRVWASNVVWIVWGVAVILLLLTA